MEYLNIYTNQIVALYLVIHMYKREFDSVGPHQNYNSE